MREGDLFQICCWRRWVWDWAPKESEQDKTPLLRDACFCLEGCCFASHTWTRPFDKTREDFSGGSFPFFFLILYIPTLGFQKLSKGGLQWRLAITKWRRRNRQIFGFSVSLFFFWVSLQVDFHFSSTLFVDYYYHSFFSILSKSPGRSPCRAI